MWISDSCSFMQFFFPGCSHHDITVQCISSHTSSRWGKPIPFRSIPEGHVYVTEMICFKGHMPNWLAFHTIYWMYACERLSLPVYVCVRERECVRVCECLPSSMSVCWETIINIHSRSVLQGACLADSGLCDWLTCSGLRPSSRSFCHRWCRPAAQTPAWR